MIALPLGAGFTLLLVGAELLVRGGAALALRMGIAPLVVGLTVVAMGTSSPELVVSLRAAVEGRSGIAVGNVVGSNICNIALILGLCAVMRPLRVQLSLVRREIPLLIVVTGLGWRVLTDGASRAEGALLVLGFVSYLVFTVVTARRVPASGELLGAVVVPVGSQRPVWMSLIMVLVGIVGLTAGAGLFVKGAVGLAETLGVSRAVIGLTVVALGTSLPELATSLVATVRGETDLAVGNVVGSNLFNVLGVLGATAWSHPIDAGGVGTIDQALSLGLAMALLPVAFSGFRVSRSEGAFFLAIYAGYLTWRFH